MVDFQLIFLGAPGSGKGTQAKLLESRNGYTHISTGDLLRTETKNGSELGKEVKSVVERGELVSDELVARLLKKNCDLKKGKYIFDGFPRNTAQLQILHSEVIKENKYKSLYFHIPTEELIKRIVNRRVCKNCGAIFNLIFNPPKEDGKCDVCNVGMLYQRDDDHESTVQNRIAIFQSTMSDVLSRYRDLGTLIELNASLPLEKLYKEIESKVLKL